MADESVDFITETTGDDDKYWYSYDNIVYEGTSVNENNEIFRPTDAIIKDDTEPNGKFRHEEEEEANGFVATDCMDGGVLPEDYSKHNLILKEVITEQGLITETYFCQECFVEYSDVNEFLRQHPGVELLNEKPEEEEEEDIIEEEDETIVAGDQVKFERAEQTQDKLWDLVENIGEEDNEEEPLFSDLIEQKKPEEYTTVSNDVKSEVLDAEGERYFCYECQQVFTDLKSAEEHDCMQTEEKDAEQQEVEETEEPEVEDTEQPEVDATEQPEVEGVDFTCVYCRQTYSSYDELLIHMSNCEDNATVPLNTRAATFHCDICNKVYRNLRGFTNHQRLHMKVTGPIKCDICNTNFQSPKNLKLHMKMHKERSLKSILEALPAGAQQEYSELNQFYCEICNKSFDQKLLAIHKNMHQNVEEYNCGKCNKQFENSISYEMHIQMHNETKGHSTKQTIAPDLDLFGNPAPDGRKKHACQYCGKEFQRPYEKVKHERIHTGEKPYNCEVCGKTFRVSYSLTLHLRTHTDIRPYVCATCNKRFKQQSVYVHHMKTHIAERQYRCEVCGKSFRTSVQLCGHRNSHKKPFNCTECNRPFASMYAVKVHMKTHNKTHKANKNLKNRCDICGASYARIFALRYHLKEQHGVEVDPGQLLDAEHSALNNKDMDVETAILMNAANEAQLGDEHNGEINFMNDEDGDDDNDADVGAGVEDHHGGATVHRDDDLDETVAATQTILQNEEIVVDHFHPEEIITDWLK